jgi:hypothetical protein
MIELEDAILVETKQLRRSQRDITGRAFIQIRQNGSVDIPLIRQLGSHPCVVSGSRVSGLYDMLVPNIIKISVCETIFILLHQSILFYCIGETL